MSSLLAAAPSKRKRAAGVKPAAHHPDALNPTAAHALLADLGFLLVTGAPLVRGPSYLLVALRPRPTRTHFDPERIEFWAIDETGAGRAEPDELEWPMPARDVRYGWGTIQIVDRLAATNPFVSFGGRLTVSRDVDVQAALFKSEAPILALPGHSGPADLLATNICAFFGTLRAASGSNPALGIRVNHMSPAAIYSAFLLGAIERYQAPLAIGSVPPRLMSMLRVERSRLEREWGADYATGRDLAANLAALSHSGPEDPA